MVIMLVSMLLLMMMMTMLLLLLLMSIIVAVDNNCRDNFDQPFNSHYTIFHCNKVCGTLSKTYTFFDITAQVTKVEIKFKSDWLEPMYKNASTQYRLMDANIQDAVSNDLSSYQ